MTLFSSLSPELCLALEGLLFLSVFGELSLCLYRFFSTRKISRCIREILVFVILVLFLSFAAETARLGKLSAFSFNVPWILFPILSAVILIHSGLGIIAEIRANRNRLSKDSVREAVDNLTSGLFFADGSGRVVLSNKVMNSAMYVLLGTYPQAVSELKDFPHHIKEDSGVTPAEDMKDTFVFPDGKVLAFKTDKLDNPGLSDFTLTSAKDISDIYMLSEKIRKENDALRISNDKLKKTHLLIGDKIKEKEALELKVRAHNEIGYCLASIIENLKGNEGQDINIQLKKLCNAAGSVIK